MEYFRVVNWKKFQHYSKRNPPWIKLYVSLLSSPDFYSLDDAQKWCIAAIWLLASKLNNKIPYDSRYVTSQTGVKSQIDLDFYLSGGYIEMLASVSVSLSEEKKDTSREEKTNTAGGNGFHPPTLAEVKKFWDTGSEQGLRLRGSPTAFFDNFASSGWVDGLGRKIVDWQAKARDWARKERAVPS